MKNCWTGPRGRRLDKCQAADDRGRTGTQIGRTLKDIAFAVKEKKTETRGELDVPDLEER